MVATVNPDQILKQLDELWTGLGGERQEDGSVGVLRAGSINIFALSSDTPKATQPTDAIASVLEEYPGRLINIRIREGSSRALDASVSAQCWMPFGKRRHICVEQVNIDATRAGLADLPPVLRALRAPDLPAILWCRDAGLLDGEDGSVLPSLCDKLILNSCGYPNPSKMLDRLLDWRERGTVVADLSWTRLTRWRETIARLFASEDRRELLKEARNVTVTYFGDRPPLRAAYLGAWFQSTLGPDVKCKLISAGDLAPYQPEGEVQAAALSGPGLDLSISQTGGDSAEIRLGNLVTQTVFHKLDETDLLREELAIEGRDPVFETILPTSAGFLAAPKRS